MNKDSVSYLACPHGHPDPSVRDYRFRVATKVAAQLFSQDLLVYSPLTHTIPMFAELHQTASWELCMRLDKAMLARCQEIIVITIPGWKESRGVTEELAYAHELGIPSRYIDFDSLTPSPSTA